MDIAHSFHSSSSLLQLRSISSTSLSSSPSLSLPRSFLRLRSPALPATQTLIKAAAFGLSSLIPTRSMAKLKKGENLRIYESTEALTKDLAAQVAQLSDHTIANSGAFTVVLSGGSLISALGKLVESPFLESVEWSNWHIFWADERVVKKTHPDSNFKLAFDGLLSKVPIPPGHLYAINDTLSAEDAAKDYEAVLKQLVKQGILKTSDHGYPRFDLLLLGMGPDGHVASLFPGHPLVYEKQKWITYILDSPKPPPERITFTFPVINAAANVFFVATGAGKADMLQRVFGEQLPNGSLPAQEVFPDEGKLMWFTDKAASAKL